MISNRFPEYSEHDPLVPVWCATPGDGGYIHRFFDTSPFSPSGRYLALTRLPYEDRVPSPGDPAEVILVDLQEGSERVIAQSCGWDTQLGTQAQWGTDDTQLFFNDLDTDTWRPHGVKMNPQSGDRKDLDGTVYMVSPDGRFVASPSFLKMGLTQLGYGVITPPGQVPPNRWAPEDDGIFVTCTDTGKTELLVSLRTIVESAIPAIDPDAYREGDFYGFHVKWNCRGDRLMFVLRWVPHSGGKMKHDLITMNADGTDIRLAIPEAIWGKGGHHPNWTPDGDGITINLKLDGQTLRLASSNWDGDGLSPMTEAVVGSGHPTLHPNGRHIVTDVYLHEPLAFGDGTTPIRWIDLETGTEETLVRINNDPPFPGPKKERRIDPHPAWDRSFRWIAFNGCEAGTRKVYIADLQSKLQD
jgi:hypothetical protein